MNVYRHRPEGWFSEPTISYEIVARDQKGKAVWVADDELEAAAELAQSLADTESAIAAREILRRCARNSVASMTVQALLLALLEMTHAARPSPRRTRIESVAHAIHH